MQARIVLTQYPMSHGSEAARTKLKPFEEIVLRLFAAYQPKLSNDISGAYSYPAYDMTVLADDPQFEAVLQEFSAQLKKARPPLAAFVGETPMGEEVKRARFLEPIYYTFEVDGGQALNPECFLCEHCERPNLDHQPRTLLVNKDVLKKYDIFHTGLSRIVVRPRVLELLQNAVGDQIEFGEAAIAKAKVKTTGDDRLFWVRPKTLLGKLVRILDGEVTCPACKRTSPKWFGCTDDKVNKAGPGLVDNRYQVEHYGSGKADIALIPECQNYWPKVVMSGALLAHLKASGVKGIMASTASLSPTCVFSQKGEPTLEPKARTFAVSANPAKEKQDKSQLEQARKATGALKDVPWDCTSDGHVYFHLTTPEFIVLDPMTAEEDSGGPYVVKDFKEPGLYRMPVSAIKAGDEEKRGVAVDSATLLFVDGAFLSAFHDAYEWEKATKKGDLDRAYHQRIAETIGTRFGVCTTPPAKYKSAFVGDGFYRIEVKNIKPAKA